MPRAEGIAPTSLRIVDLGSIDYAQALHIQRDTLDEMLHRRESGDPLAGVLYLLEHDPPVITLSKRAQDGAHLLASRDQLEAQGVTLHETDRGGDITYHGPGQLVVYPILDLNRLGVNLHAYIRLLEQVVMDYCADLGLHTKRDPDATGVWMDTDSGGAGGGVGGGGGGKVCAIGIRVRRWITMHGFALNVATNLDHFNLIVPCGLAGRAVTTLHNELGAHNCPPMPDVKQSIAERFAAAFGLEPTPGSDPRGRRP